MNRSEIIELWKQAADNSVGDEHTVFLCRFAALIEAAMIERCAVRIENGSFLHDKSPAKLFATEASAAIRSLK